jgi:hypothetical protein
MLGAGSGRTFVPSRGDSAFELPHRREVNSWPHAEVGTLAGALTMWVRWPTYDGLEELRPPSLHPAQSGTPHSQQGG